MGVLCALRCKGSCRLGEHRRRPESRSSRNASTASRKQGQFAELTEVSRVSSLCGHVSCVHHHLPKVRAQPDSLRRGPGMLWPINQPSSCQPSPPRCRPGRWPQGPGESSLSPGYEGSSGEIVSLRGQLNSCLSASPPQDWCWQGLVREEVDLEREEGGRE